MNMLRFSLLECLFVDIQENGIRKPLLIFVGSILLSYITYEGTKKADISLYVLRGIAIFSWIVICFLMSSFMLNVFLSGTDTMRRIKEEEYIIKKKNKTIHIGGIKLTLYDYIQYQIIYLLYLIMFLYIVIVVKIVFSKNNISLPYLNAFIHMLILFSFLYLAITFFHFLNKYVEIVKEGSNV